MRSLLHSLSFLVLVVAEPIRLQPDVQLPPEERPSTPSFEVERLDAPMERIEIRLIDENSTSPLVIDLEKGERQETTGSDHTHNSLPQEPPPIAEVVEGDVRSRERYAVHNDIDETSTSPLPSADETTTEESPPNEERTTSPFEEITTTTTETPRTESEAAPREESEYRREDESQGYAASYPTSTVASDDYDSAPSTGKMPTRPPYPAMFVDDDLPIPAMDASASDDEPEPVEECLGNQKDLSSEVVERLNSQARKLNRLIRRLNKQQQQYCQERPVDEYREYRQCTVWREEKLVHYYQLMRVTYCSDYSKWPNAPRIKRTYPPETLHFYETLYAFTQKQ